MNKVTNKINWDKWNSFLVKTDGTIIEQNPEVGQKFSLKELQKFVGGYIEMFPLQNEWKLYCNENGKLASLPPNFVATELFGYPLVGNVIFVKKTKEVA
jgi:hypothetical protein